MENQKANEILVFFKELLFQPNYDTILKWR